jgi:hypothetical protein
MTDNATVPCLAFKVMAKYVSVLGISSVTIDSISRMVIFHYISNTDKSILLNSQFVKIIEGLGYVVKMIYGYVTG